MTNAVNWFEIPVKDFDRAKAFYSTILGEEVIDAPMEGAKYGFLPYDKEGNGVGGGIVEMKDYNPSQDGTTVYLNGGVDLSLSLSRVERSGGKVIMPKTPIGENGFIAKFLDTEGNMVALHSMN